MTVPFMDSYVKLLIQTCHKRGVHAMVSNGFLRTENLTELLSQGGMAAQIPIKDDKKANDIAMANVYADKLREVRAGHDGTWVAHPALAFIAAEVFNKHMPTPNQLFVRKDNVRITQNDLLNMNVPGTITEEGIRKNLNIGLGYMEGWLRGIGCVPINYLMVGHQGACGILAKNFNNGVSRRMLLRRKSVAASSGNGVAMAL